MTSIRRFGWTALALFALVGCEAPAPPVTPATATPTVSTEPGKPTEAAPAGTVSDAANAEIMKLPADEQPIALAQKLCPVSGDPLGGEMGMPIKQKIGDTTFFICCESCEKKVKSKPDDVLAALAKLKK